MSSTTEQSFRASLSQFRWARGNTNDSQQAQAAGQQQSSSSSSNPFSRFYNAIGGNGYIPLRSSERSNEEEAYFALSRWERCVCLFFEKTQDIDDHWHGFVGCWDLELVYSAQRHASSFLSCSFHCFLYDPINSLSLSGITSRMRYTFSY